MISPLIFSIFTESLNESLLNDNFPENNHMLYADDMVILSKDIDSLKRALQQVEDWSQTYGMVLNKKKCAFMKFLKKWQREDKINKIGDLIMEVPIVRSYKYLGIQLDHRLKLEEHKKMINKKLMALLRSTRPFT